ncbi:hypothetical protein KY343_01495 [Candidatus Woesearchaeota archaeon]|nr:hypothetical protein [Candidatus Woesearchaeota archaeon]
MSENHTTLKKYGAILLVGVLGGWYFSSKISDYFSKVEERTQVIRDGVEYVWNLGNEVKPEPVKESVDKPIIGLYERFFGKKETVDDKVTQE